MRLDNVTDISSGVRSFPIPRNDPPVSAPIIRIVPVDDSPLTIVHVVRQYHPAIGGLEAVVEQLARRQAADGFHVRVVTLDRLFGAPDCRLPAREVIDGVEVIRIPFRGSRRYPLAPSVLRHFKGAALIHVHAIDFFFDFLAATHRIHRIPMIATTHGGFFHTQFAGGLKRHWFNHVTRWSAHRYAAVVACSDSDAALFRTLSPPRLETIENGIDLDRFAWQPPRSVRAMICFGRLSSNKGLDDLLAWFAAVRRLDPLWTLTIAGSPDGVEPEDLERQAATLGIAEAVRVVVSPDAAALSDLIADAGVFCSASHYEGFGIAALEAGISGLFPFLRDIEPFALTIKRLGVGMLSDFAATDEAAGRFLEGWQLWLATDATCPSPASVSLGWKPANDAYVALYRNLLRAPLRRIGLVDIEVHQPTEIIQLIDRHVAIHAPLTLAFCNAHTVNMARGNAQFASSLREAVVVNDGVGVDVASRILFGHAFPQNLCGTDLTPAILAGVQKPLRIFLVGAAPGVAQRAAIALARRFPRHSFIGTNSGYLSSAEEPALCRRIVAAKADLVLVGMGHPRQELWAKDNAPALGAVIMCVGAFFDFAAGEVSRAPAWIRSLRMEWLYRLMLEPKRLAPRYLFGNPAFLFHVLRQRYRPATA